MNQKTIFQRVLTEYKKAWETRDPDLAIRLFTPTTTYQEDPFDTRPMRGLREIRAYWAEVPKFPKNISFTYGPIFQLGRSKVWGAEWSARYTKVKTGEKVKLKGVLFCELRGERIQRFWEYWHIRGGKPSFRAKTSKSTSLQRSKSAFAIQRNPRTL